VSQQNVGLARRIYENGDLLHTTPERIDRVFREQLSEDFEFRLPPDYPEGELVFRRRSGIDELIVLLRETWRPWALRAGVVPRRRRAGGGLRAESRARRAPRSPRPRVSFREGPAVSVQVYRDRADALEATGLSA